MGIKSFLGLSLALAKAEFKLRNEGTYLGIFWYLLGPILTFLILLAIFSYRLGQNIPDYALYLLLGIIMFNFFQQTTTESTRIMMINRGIIRSIKFRLDTLTSSVVLKSLYSHIFEILIFGMTMLFFGISPFWLVFYFFILAIMSIFVFGVSLVLSSLIVYFVDLENIWTFASRVLWFATPIFYAISGQDKLFILNLFNPIYYFITIARDIIISHTVPAAWMLAGCLFYALLALLIGLFVFNKLKDKFAEML